MTKTEFEGANISNKTSITDIQKAIVASPGRKWENVERRRCENLMKVLQCKFAKITIHFYDTREDACASVICI
jgi:hypothetical protein